MNSLESQFASIQEVDCQDVLVVHTPMTREQAREEYPGRPHEPTKTRLVESRYGGVGYAGGDVEMMMNKEGVKCAMCEAPTKKDFLKEGVCPDCDGRAEAQGNDPRRPQSV